VEERGHDPSRDRLARFPARHDRPGREAPVDLGERHPLRVAVIALDERLVELRLGEPQLVGDELPRLPGPAQRARDDPVPVAAPGEQPSGRAGLLPPGVVERDVGEALDAAGPVPVGLAVAHEEEFGHRRRFSRTPPGNAERQLRASRSAPSTSLVPASIFTLARVSPFVSPRLTTTIGTRRFAAWSSSRMPELTTSEDPAMRSASAPRTRALALRNLPVGTNSPKNTTSGLRMPPRTLQSGTTIAPTSSTATSPAGLSGRSSAISHGLSCAKRCAIASRANRWPQRRQRT